MKLEIKINKLIHCIFINDLKKLLKFIKIYKINTKMYLYVKN